MHHYYLPGKMYICDFVPSVLDSHSDLQIEHVVSEPHRESGTRVNQAHGPVLLAVNISFSFAFQSYMKGERKKKGNKNCQILSGDKGAGAVLFA